MIFLRILLEFLEISFIETRIKILDKNVIGSRKIEYIDIIDQCLNKIFSPNTFLSTLISKCVSYTIIRMLFNQLEVETRSTGIMWILDTKRKQTKTKFYLFTIIYHLKTRETFFYLFLFLSFTFNKYPEIDNKIFKFTSDEKSISSKNETLKKKEIFTFNNFLYF